MAGTDPSVLVLARALAAQRAGRLPEALQLLQGLLAREPAHVDALNLLAATCIQAGQPAAALQATDRVLAASRSPQARALALVRRSAALEALQQPRLALAAAEQAVAASPGDALAVAALATALEKNRRAAEAVPLLQDALRRDAGNGLLRIKLARCRLAGGDAAQALADLAPLAPEALPPAWQRELAFLRAQALERNGEHAAAWDAYAAANALAARLGGHAGGAGLPFLNTVRRMVDTLRAREGRWTPPADDAANDAAPRTAFLLGFPRTGSTLLDQLLGGSAQVTALEEKPLLQPALAQLTPAEQRLFPASAMALDGARRAAMRKAWLDAATGHAGGPLRPLVLDKQPLNTIYLPLLLALFPQGQVVFLMRDPLDVVLSCWCQDFAPSPAMDCFQRLDTTVALYDAVMQLWTLCRERIDFSPLTLRYEDLVDDLPGRTRALYAALGLDWSDDVLDFRRTGAGREVSTASYNQVARGLYRGSVGRWQAHAGRLAPWREALAPWRRAFGYGD